MLSDHLKTCILLLSFSLSINIPITVDHHQQPMAITLYLSICKLLLTLNETGW